MERIALFCISFIFSILSKTSDTYILKGEKDRVWDNIYNFRRHKEKTVYRGMPKSDFQLGLRDVNKKVPVTKDAAMEIEEYLKHFRTASRYNSAKNSRRSRRRSNQNGWGWYCQRCGGSKKTVPSCKCSSRVKTSCNCNGRNTKGGNMTRNDWQR